jgi:serine/threonine protein kinase
LLFSHCHDSFFFFPCPFSGFFFLSLFWPQFSISSCQRSARLMTEQAIWRFFVQIASALEHIHSRRIVHRGKKFELMVIPYCTVVNISLEYRARTMKPFKGTTIIDLPFFIYFFKNNSIFYSNQLYEEEQMLVLCFHSVFSLCCSLRS